MTPQEAIKLLHECVDYYIDEPGQPTNIIYKLYDAIATLAALVPDDNVLPEPLPTLLRDAAKSTGSHDPAEVMPMIEEQLTGNLYQIAFGFLTWLKENDFTFGWNIQSVYKAYRTGDTSCLKTVTELNTRIAQ